MVAESQFMTASEFAKLPESSTPMELIDGVLIVSPTPAHRHQKLTTRLTYPLIGIELEGGNGVWISSPLDLYVSPHNVYQPDALLFEAENEPDPDLLPVTEIPEIVVEVLSPSSRSRDNVRKRVAYAERGIGEYWIVDTQLRRIVFNIADQNGTYTSHELDGAIIPVGRYAGVNLDIDWIFAVKTPALNSDSTES
jgi:Uma2 family endonuclease